MNTGGIIDKRNIVNYTTGKVGYVDKDFTVSPTSGSKFSLNFEKYDVDSIVKTVGSGSYALSANVNINAASGKVNGIGTSDTVYYSPTSPELIFQVGYPYVAQLINTSYYSQRVYRSKSFTGNTLTIQATSGNSSNPLKFEGTGTLSASAAEQLFIVIDNSNGNILDFTTSGNTISISGDKTTATLTLGAAVPTNKNVTVIAQVQVNSGDSSSFVLKSKSLVTGNTTIVGTLTAAAGYAYHDLTKGQIALSKSAFATPKNMSLYVNDVKSIKKVFDTGSSSWPSTGADTSSYTDITRNFILDNGQRDTYYDHAAIALRPGSPIPKGTILVVVDYYSHKQASSGDGYFSIQSYNTSGSTYGGVSSSAENYTEIGSYTATNGNNYNLKDCIDFRPCRVNAQTAYVWEYSGTQLSTNDLGILIPSNLTNFTGFYQYYLGRKDRLVLTKDKSLNIIQGSSSINPSLPNEPEGSLLLANLIHDPYTAFVPGEGIPGVTSNLSVDKIIHKRWAKKDISDLEGRINNLEYYTALSILEQNANSLQVSDSNGLNRFKNGILVDDFSSFATADTNNPDYTANINIRKNQLGPLQFVDNFQLQNPVVLSSLATVPYANNFKINSINGAQTNLFLLPYASQNVISQSAASGSVSVNPFNVVTQEGILKLNPPMDNWVDNTKSPAVLITSPNFQVYQENGGVNLLNSGDYATIPGTLNSTSTTTQVGQTTSATTTAITSTTNFSTTTQTYGSQIQNTTSGAYNPSSSTLAMNNNYLTSIALLPYIRPQQIIIQASGLLVNAELTTLFDGVDVSQYLSAASTIELTGVSGTFKTNDIVGFYVSSKFYPIARVISVFQYLDITKTRLYVSEILGAPNTLGSTKLQNAFYDSNGNYNYTTASGTVSSNSVIGVHQSGSISAVGGGWSNTLNSGTTTALIGTPIVQGYSTLLNQYGVWGDARNTTSFTFTYPVEVTTAGTYTIELGTSGNATMYANGVSIGSKTGAADASNTTIFTTTFALGTVNLGVVASSSGNTISSVGFTIKNSSGDILLTSINPPVTHVNGGNAVNMPYGGQWFVGATQLRLDPSTASNTANFYVGSTINITSKLVYGYEVGASFTGPGNDYPSGGAGSFRLGFY
jgi:hypothetical protein